MKNLYIIRLTFLQINCRGKTIIYVYFLIVFDEDILSMLNLFMAYLGVVDDVFPR